MISRRDYIFLSLAVAVIFFAALAANAIWG
jgi:hypothetical protein